MAGYTVITSDEAKKHLAKHHSSGNKAIIKRIERIFEELGMHPESGIGQPERLKYNLSNKWSRRISQKHRLIYEIKESIVLVEVLSAWGHYDDK
jgi:toxin YoeB